MRSRTKPALFTTTSSPPNASSRGRGRAGRAPSKSATSSPLATASPPERVGSPRRPRRPGRVRARAVELDAEVVDDDRRALAGELERVGPPEPAPRAGDDDDAPVADPGPVASSHRPSAGYRTRVRYGITMFATDLSMSVPELARAAEERGLHSLYVPEHTHIPTSRRTPPPTGDAELREEYKRTLDPFVALAGRGGGDRADPPRHRDLPGRAARADRHRQGRRDARPPLGRPVRARHRLRLERRRDREPRRRRAATAATVAREHMLAMQALWTDDVASFDGELRAARAVVVVAQARAARAGRRCSSAARAGPKLFAHIAEYADGWIPIGGAGIRAALPDLHARVRGGRPRSGDAADRARSARSPTRASSTTTRRSASTRSCCASRARRPTSCSRSSTSTPPSRTIRLLADGLLSG